MSIFKISYKLSKQPPKKVINTIYDRNRVDFDSKLAMTTYIDKAIEEYTCRNCNSLKIKSSQYTINYRMTKIISEEKSDGIFGRVKSVVKLEYYSILKSDYETLDCRSCKKSIRSYNGGHSFLDSSTFNISPDKCALMLMKMPPNEASKFCQTELMEFINNAEFEKLVGKVGSNLWRFAFDPEAKIGSKHLAAEGRHAAGQAWKSFIGICSVLKNVDMEKLMSPLPDRTISNEDDNPLVRGYGW